MREHIPPFFLNLPCALVVLAKSSYKVNGHQILYLGPLHTSNPNTLMNATNEGFKHLVKHNLVY